MLRLKKLQMLGFKSFCDRTELQFPGRGVVAVVGPNGCGKSNLADAISWVLGEQSAKSLRGGRMEDVIFAGTRDRVATGMAEVSLTLIDPDQYEVDLHQQDEPSRDELISADGAGPGEAEWSVDADALSETPGISTVSPESAETSIAAGDSDAIVLTIRKRRKFTPHNRRGEVVVTRRLYRSGESEYMMNGRPCRLRDIQDLFMGTGLGPDCYAIIEQGRVGQILSSKPHDRRAIIEEAAGVSKYKARRRLAEARLESARQNLLRINDIFEEVVRQVGSLKRQASKAQRYRALKAEFDLQQRRLMSAKAAALSSATTTAQARESECAVAVHAAQDDMHRRETSRGEWQRHCTALEQELSRRTEAAGTLVLEHDRRAQQLMYQREKSQDLARRAESNRDEGARLEEQCTRLENELQLAAVEQSTSEGVLAEARALCDRQRTAHQTAQAALQDLEGRVESARRRTLELLSQHATSSNQIAHDETLLTGLERHLERLQREEAVAAQELERGGVKRGQLTLQFQGDDDLMRQLTTRLTALEQQAVTLQAEEVHARREVEEARAMLAELAARRRSLEEIVAHHGYSSEAVKRLFAASPNGGSAAAQYDDNGHSDFHPLGVLGEFVEVETRYERVVEEFLRDELNFVVVRNWDQAGAGVGLLRTQEQGRATFLVHVEAADGSATTADPDMAHRLRQEAGLTPLLHEVKALNGFKNGLAEILPKLRDAYLLPDTDRARQLATQYPRAYFLTPQGECFHYCTVTGGAGTSTGPLSLKRELRDLVHSEATVGSVLAEAEQRLQLRNHQLEASIREREELKSQHHEIEKRLLTSGQAVRQVDSEMERLRAHVREWQLESQRGTAERNSALERLQQSREELRAIENQQSAAQSQESAAAALIEGARRERDLTSQHLGEAHSSLARLEERARAAHDACQRIERLTADLNHRRAHMSRELEQLEQRRAALITSCQDLEAQLEGLRTAAEQAVTAKAVHEGTLEQARQRGQAMEAEMTAQREVLEGLRQAHGECEIALARLEADAQHLRESCSSDLGCSLDELCSAAAETETGATVAPISVDLIETAVRDLRSRIDGLGPVNMMALEEFEEAQKRHDFMQTQRCDLLDSIANTQKAISEIDEVSRQKFDEAFEQINQYFQETFRVLFGGGQGFLRMSEVDPGANLSDAGVDLVAQPPGKKLQNALLLSGGEKAMTAMALLLAVFRYQPSPFCLLDEVDAPMDEANVVRFSDMVKQMSAATQFILITHNKRTMEAAPVLYGVTMPQAGVSRLVSVNLDEQSPSRSASVA